MAKIFITNSRDIYFRLNAKVKSADFRKSFDYVKDGLYALEWQPVTIKESQVFLHENNWCLVSGLCINHASIDPELIYNDFILNDDSIRQKMLGQYCVALHNDSTTVVLSDTSACHDVFYFNKDGIFFISDSLFDMVCAMQDKVTVSEPKIVQKAIYHSLWNGETFYDEIKRLHADEKIEIREDKFSVISADLEIKEQVKTSLSQDDVISAVSEKLKENARAFYQAVGVPSIFITGGLDSRLILAAFLSADVKPKLIYMRGLNWADPQDEDIARRYAKAYNLSLQIEDVRDFSMSEDEYIWQIYSHGFNTAYSWGGNAKVLRKIQKTNKCVIFGWGGELYRHMENIGFLDEFVKTYYEFSPNHNDVDTSLPIVRENFVSSLKEEVKHWGMSLDSMSCDDWYFMQYIGMSHRDMHLPMLSQQLGYCYCSLFEASVLKYIHALEKDKNIDGAEFQIRVINALFPDLLSIPIFSCRRYQYIEKETMSLTPVNPTLTKVKEKRLYNYIWTSTPNWLKEMLLKPLRDKIFKKNYKEPEADNTQNELYKTLLQLEPLDVQCPVEMPNLMATGWEDMSTYILLMKAVQIINEDNNENY